MTARPKKITSTWVMWFFVGMHEMKKRVNTTSLKAYGKVCIESQLSRGRMLI